MSNQGTLQQALRDTTGTAHPFNGDWLAFLADAGFTTGTFNERMLAWLNDTLGVTYTSITAAQNAYAEDQGVSGWSAITSVTPPVATDPYWANVVLLLDFEGTDGATSTTDESPTTPHAITFAGTAQVDTAQSAMGGASLLLDGNSDRVSAADSIDFEFGSGAFTVEAYIRPAVVTGTQVIVAKWGDAAPNLEWTLRLEAAVLKWRVSTTGSDNLNDLSGGTISADTWSHVAVDWDGTTQRLYVGGTMVASTTTARTIYAGSYVLSVGSNSLASGQYFNGNIDGVRITKGVARYATDGSYTPPTSYPRA